MRGFVIIASLALVLSAAPTFAQTPPAQSPAAAPAQAAPAPAPQPPMPFPAGAKIAFVNFQRVVGESTEGKASTTRVNALIAKKQTEGNDKAKKLQADQQKLQTSGSLMSDVARIAARKGRRARAGRRAALPAGRAGRGAGTADRARGRLHQAGDADSRAGRVGARTAGALQRAAGRLCLGRSGPRSHATDVDQEASTAGISVIDEAGLVRSPDHPIAYAPE